MPTPSPRLVGRGRSRARVLNRPPDPLRRERHVEVRDAPRLERVDHRVRHRRRRPDRRRLADALRPERVQVGPRLGVMRLECGKSTALGIA